MVKVNLGQPAYTSRSQPRRDPLGGKVALGHV